MKRESDRKCVSHARVHASVYSFDRCEGQRSRFLVLTKKSAASGTRMILSLPIQVDTITGEKSLGCISMTSMFPEKRFNITEKRFNVMVKRKNTRVEYKIGSQKGLADTNKLNVVRVVQNGNKILDRR